MATIHKADFEHSGIGRGIKVAALVLILTAAALTTDHKFFAGPTAPAAASPVTATVATAGTAALDGFALPESLRPTAADVTTGTPTF